MADEFHDAVAQRLRRVGQRYTAGRRALIEVILDAGRPVTAADLVTANARMPQSTTYRNLAVLEQAGVLHRLRSTDDFARFELSEELAGHHHHLVCVSCGGVEDFTLPAPFERNLTAQLRRITTRTGFRAQAHRLDLLGTCGACA
jgi:Fe2+ or Zn2+ uptake regulation protein